MVGQRGKCSTKLCGKPRDAPAQNIFDCRSISALARRAVEDDVTDRSDRHQSSAPSVVVDVDASLGGKGTYNLRFEHRSDGKTYLIASPNLTCKPSSVPMSEKLHVDLSWLGILKLAVIGLIATALMFLIVALIVEIIGVIAAIATLVAVSLTVVWDKMLAPI